MSILVSRQLEVRAHTSDLSAHYARLEAYLLDKGPLALSRHPAWLTILQRGLGHTPYLFEAVEGGKTFGILPLSFVHSWLFGKFLVSLPYVNSGGIVADDDFSARRLVDAAVKLADEKRVKYLELRHEKVLEHTAFNDRLSNKVHMRLALPATAGKLWDGLHAKVRNQVRKGQKNDLTAEWGGVTLLPAFYEVFSRNMRDLGTPVYGQSLFVAMLEQFPERVEFCVVRKEKQPIAAGLLLHGWGITEVPSASSLREFNATNANMLLYWNLLQRAVERGQSVFDFGRSTIDCNTYKFKKQWGAKQEPAEWQYYRRNGTVRDVRPDNPRYQQLIRWWQKLPLGVANLLGPHIVRGIP